MSAAVTPTLHALPSAERKSKGSNKPAKAAAATAPAPAASAAVVMKTAAAPATSRSKKEKDTAQHKTAADSTSAAAHKPAVSGAAPAASTSAAAAQADTDTAQAIDTTVQTQALRTRSAESNSCLVCCDPISATNPVWSCPQCYAAFHLLCIAQWGRACVSNSKQAQLRHLFPAIELFWYCPHCRLQQSEQQIPTKYLCWCGQTEDPKHDPVTINRSHLLHIDMYAHMWLCLM
jgi:transcriptional repressor NF-X1